VLREPVAQLRHRQRTQDVLRKLVEYRRRRACGRPYAISNREVESGDARLLDRKHLR
jgi:hypothetical protein